MSHFGCLLPTHSSWLHRMLGGNLGGAVFVCSAGTVQSCLQKGLLGMMQDTFIPIVQHVSLGMPVNLAAPRLDAPLGQCHISCTVSRHPCIQLALLDQCPSCSVVVLQTVAGLSLPEGHGHTCLFQRSVLCAGVPVQPLGQDLVGAAVCCLTRGHVPGGASLGQTRAQISLACSGQCFAQLYLAAWPVRK